MLQQGASFALDFGGLCDHVMFSCDCRMEFLLARVLEGRPQPKLVEHVDMKTKLDDLGLGQLFPPNSWPPPAAVRELQHKAKGLEKVGVKRPFVACDLRKCVFSSHAFFSPPPQFACSAH